MNATGLCGHNNLANYCPTCAREKAYNLRATMSGGMGEECQPGFYRLKVFGVDTGQCLPTLSTATQAAQTGVLSSVATGVATSPTNVAAAQEAGIKTVANKTVAYIKENPILVASAVGIIGLLAFYGFGKMTFGRG